VVNTKNDNFRYFKGGGFIYMLLIINIIWYVGFTIRSRGF